MRDIYLIDFENVASEGLSGITYLSEEDQVIIFYSNNSNRLTMKMHILISKSVCKLDYFEVTVGGKNALDHQIATWLGYLVGTGGAERNYYIVSRDMGYKHVANFWAANSDGPRVRCVDTIKAAGRLERKYRENRESVLQAVPVEPEQPESATEPVDLPVAEEAAPVEVAEGIAPVAEIPAEAEPIPEETAEVMAEAAVTEEADTAPEEPQPEESQQEEPRKNYRTRTRGARRSRTKAREPQAAQEPQMEETKAEPVAAPEETPQPVAAQSEAPVKQAKKQPQKRQNQKPREKNAEPQQGGSFDQLAVMIAPYPKLQESVLRDLIANNKRQILCNTLRKHLGQEKGLALYNEIKRAAWH